MKKIAILLAMAAQPAAAGDLTLDVDNIINDGYQYQALVRVKNSGATAYRIASIQCAWLNAEEKAVHLGSETIANIKPMETAFGKADGPKIDGPKAARVDCRISNALK